MTFKFSTFVTFLFGLAYADAQTITFAGGVGCAVLAPGPPAGLRATPGDGKVTLEWNDPKNGACVDEYAVDVEVVSDQRFFFDWEIFTTRDHKVTIDQLENGVEHKFTVKAISNEFGQSGVSSTTIYARPEGRCLRVPPGPPTGLRAKPGNGKVELCWNGVTNSGCVDEYKVRATLVDADTRFFFDIPERVSKGGCIMIEDLDNHRAYEFTVQSWSRLFRRGGSSSIIATPKPENLWRCIHVPNSYKKCQAAVWGTCEAYSCREQARNGKCNEPWMQEVDWERRTITQHCSNFCRCPLEPSVVDTRTFLLDDHCCRRDEARPFTEWLDDVFG